MHVRQFRADHLDTLGLEHPEQRHAKHLVVEVVAVTHHQHFESGPGERIFLFPRKMSRVLFVRSPRIAVRPAHSTPAVHEASTHPGKSVALAQSVGDVDVVLDEVHTLDGVARDIERAPELDARSLALGERHDAWHEDVIGLTTQHIHMAEEHLERQACLIHRELDPPLQDRPVAGGTGDGRDAERVEERSPEHVVLVEEKGTRKPHCSLHAVHGPSLVSRPSLLTRFVSLVYPLEACGQPAKAGIYP